MAACAPAVHTGNNSKGQAGCVCKHMLFCCQCVCHYVVCQFSILCAGGSIRGRGRASTMWKVEAAATGKAVLHGAVHKEHTAQLTAHSSKPHPWHEACGTAACRAAAQQWYTAQHAQTCKPAAGAQGEAAEQPGGAGMGRRDGDGSRWIIVLIVINIIITLGGCVCGVADRVTADTDGVVTVVSDAIKMKALLSRSLHGLQQVQQDGRAETGRGHVCCWPASWHNACGDIPAVTQHTSDALHLPRLVHH